MKRLFNKLLATSLSMAIILCNTPVYAANEQYNSSVTAEVESSYIVSIPKSIELDVNTIGVGTGNYTCYAYGDIEATSSVYIVPSSQFTMTKDSSDDSTIATVSQDKTEWEYNDMNSESPVVGNGSISTNGLTAGNWNGVFYFNIEKTDSGSDVEAPVDETVEIELVDSEVVDAGTFTLGRSQVGAVQLSYKDKDVTYDAKYTSDNKNITVSDTGIINTDNATGGETATITVEYTPTESEQLDTASYSLRAAASEVSDSSTLSAYFTVQVIDIEFDKETLTLYQGDTATITANIVPDEVDGTVKWTLSGLDFGSEGNTITITVASDATPGNYVLSASYGSYMQSLNIKIVDKHVCDYGAGVVTTEPTCTVDGVRTFTCECGDSYTEVEPATGHDYDDGVITTEAKCLTPGVMTYTCSTCSNVNTSSIAALGHDYVDGVCTRCGAEDPDYFSNLAPGLYSASGKRLATWLELTEDYGLDVQADYTSSTYSGSKAPLTILTNSGANPNSLNFILVLPADVTSIGNYAFYKNTKLKQIILPSTVTEIGDYAFNGCDNLTVIKLPENLNAIGNRAFSASALKSVELPNKITAIGDYAFDNCANLASINLPDSIESIGSYAFQKCTSLYNIDIPAKVNSIGDYTFNGCTGLTSVTIPDNVTYIGKYAFKGCTSLDDLSIPDKIESIGDYAFSGCILLSNATLPSTLSSIGGYAFEGCTGLSDIIIPESVTALGNYAFSGCTNLSSATISGSGYTIQSSTFKNCLNIEEVVIYGDNITIGSSVFSSNTKLTTAKINTGVITISDYAFKDCSNLEHVDIASTVDTIGSRAFYGTKWLAGKQAETPLVIVNNVLVDGQTFSGDLTIPSVVTKISGYAFYNNANVTELSIHDSVVDIGSSAFCGTSITELTIPASVKTIGSSAFSGCKGIASITFNEGLETIDSNAFYNCTGITTVILPSTVKKVGASVFQKCSGLATIYLKSLNCTYGWKCFDTNKLGETTNTNTDRSKYGTVIYVKNKTVYNSLWEGFNIDSSSAYASTNWYDTFKQYTYVNNISKYQLYTTVSKDYNW